jgi:hypothetical protein
MKISIALAILSIILGCSSQDDKPNVLTDFEKLENSRNKWDADKPNVYTYRVFRTYGLDWDIDRISGRWVSNVVVEGGKITCRSSQQSSKEQTHNREYIEREEAIGSNDWGYEAITMDDLYEKCEKEIAKSESEINLSFFDKSEFLRDCFYPHVSNHADLSKGKGNGSIALWKFLPIAACSDFDI